MNDLRTIAALYEQVDNHFDDLRDGSTKPARKPGVTGVEREQRINDQAYFVLAWGHLEADVDDACENAIAWGRVARRVASPASVQPVRSGKTPPEFQEPSAPCPGLRPATEWRRTVEHYSVRNDIAHGTLLSQRIDVSSVIEDFYRIPIIAGAGLSDGGRSRGFNSKARN